MLFAMAHSTKDSPVHAAQLHNIMVLNTSHVAVWQGRQLSVWQPKICKAERDYVQWQLGASCPTEVLQIVSYKATRGLPARVVIWLECRLRCCSCVRLDKGPSLDTLFWLKSRNVKLSS